MSDAARAGFAILDASVPDELARWTAAWEAWPEREVFAHPAYVALDASALGGRAVAALLQGDAGCVLYPFVLRSLGGEPWCPPDAHAWSDITTPYGYGGAFCWNVSSREELARAFWAAFDDWAEANAIVAEFVRFALEPVATLPYPGERIERLTNIVRTLDPTPDALWAEYEHKVRKNVRKAERAGVSVERDQGDRLDEFLAIYRHTMERREAGARYFLPPDWFRALLRGLAGRVEFFHAVHQGRVVSTELVLVSETRVYSFLGGTLSEAFDLRPNDLLKHHVILWARAAGKREYVLGGGQAADDGILRYKRSFAPAGAVPFLVGRRVLDARRYAALCDAADRWRASRGLPAPSSGFFPAYRA